MARLEDTELTPEKCDSIIARLRTVHMNYDNSSGLGTLIGESIQALEMLNQWRRNNAALLSKVQT